MKHLLNLLKAIIIGFISCAVPGISSLTFAIVLCIYFPLVEALSGITKNFKKNALFLVIFFLGYIIGAFLGANLVSRLFATYPLVVICVIFGLLLGCLPKLIKDALPYFKKPSCWITFIIVASLFTLFQLTTKVSDTVDLSTMNLKMYLIVSLVGFVVSFSFAFPGFDYKILLLALGFYYPVMDAITNLSSNTYFWDSFIFLVCYLVGYLIGLFLFSNIIKRLINKFPGQIKFASIALIMASPYMIVSECIIHNPNFTYGKEQMVVGAILFVIFTILIIVTDLFSNPRRPKEEVMNNRNLFKLYISSFFGFFKRHYYLKKIKKQMKNNDIAFVDKFKFCTDIMNEIDRKARIEPIVKGLENLNDDITLFVVNHQGKYDAIGLLSALNDKPTSLVIKEEYFNYPYSKEILNLIECIPYDEMVEDRIRKTLEYRNVAIFIQKGNIEENTTKDLQTDLLKIAYTSKIKITPVLLYDSYLIYHKDKKEKMNVQITFLKPIEYTTYHKLTEQELAKLIEKEMQDAIEIIDQSK